MAPLLEFIIYQLTAIAWSGDQIGRPTKLVARPNWSPDQIGRPTKLDARPNWSSVHGRSMVAQWSLNGRSMVARLLWPPALSHRPKGGGKGRAAIYLGARPFWAPAQNGRSGLFKTAALCVIGIQKFCLFRGVPNGIFQQNILLDKESIPELRFFIS